MKTYYFNFLLFCLSLFTNFSFAQTHCIPNYVIGCTSGDGISSFITYGGTQNISNTFSGCSPNGYGDFSNRIVSVAAGDSFDFRIESLQRFQTYSIWIDLDNNGIFDLPQEQVFHGSTTLSDTAVGTINIPSTNLPGFRKMRVSSKRFGSSFHPCYPINNYGETEDYTVNILPITPCTTPLNSAQISFTDTSLVCPFQTVNLKIDDDFLFEGQTYQWELSSDSVNWSILPNDTNFYMFHTLIDDTYFRCQVTCSGQTTASQEVKAAIIQPLAGVYEINANLPTNIHNQTFNSYSDAVEVLTCAGISDSVILNVAPGSGPYNEQFEIGNINGVSANNYIKINGNNNILTAETQTSQSRRHVVKLNNAKHVIIENINFQAPISVRPFYLNIVIQNNSDSIIIRNNEFKLGSNYITENHMGVFAGDDSQGTNQVVPGNHAGHLEIYNNTFKSGGFGVRLIGESQNPLIEPKVYNNHFEVYSQRGVSINYAENATVDKNTFQASLATFNTFSNNMAIELFNVKEGFSVTNNYTNSFGRHFIRIAASGGTLSNKALIANNVNENYSSSTLATSVLRIENTQSSYINIFHNTFSIPNNHIGISGSIMAGNHLNIKNNIFYASGNGMIYSFQENDFADEIDYNIYFTNRIDKFRAATTYNSLSAFVGQLPTLQPNDVNSIFINPQFPNDSTLIPSNPLVNFKGTPLAEVILDIEDTPRDSITPQIGAYEFYFYMNDIAFHSFASSFFTCVLSNNESISIEYYNAGVDTIYHPYFGVSFDSSPFIMDFTTYIIPPLTYGTHVIDSTFDLSILGNSYTFQFIASVNGDEDNSNDTSQVYTLRNDSILTAPTFEDFDNFLISDGFVDNWQIIPQNDTNKFSWKVGKGYTDTYLSGPRTDYTLGDSTGKYIYTFSEPGSEGDEAFAFYNCIDLNNLNHPYIEFYYHFFGNDIGKLHIEIKDSTSNNWITLDSIVGQQQTFYHKDWERKRVSIEAFASQIVSLRLKAIRGAGNRGNMAIDDFSIIDLPEFDAAVISASIPQKGCGLGNNEIIRATVKNEGVQDINQLSISYRINNGNFVTETINQTILPHQSLQYTFSNRANLSQQIEYNIDIVVNLNGDTNTENDSLLNLKTQKLVILPPPSVTYESTVCQGDAATASIDANSLYNNMSYRWYNKFGLLYTTTQNMVFNNIADTITFYATSNYSVATNTNPTHPIFQSFFTDASGEYGIALKLNDDLSIKSVDVFNNGLGGLVSVDILEVPSGNVVHSYTGEVVEPTSNFKSTLDINSPILPAGDYGIMLTYASEGIDLRMDSLLILPHFRYPAPTANNEAVLIGYYDHSFPNHLTQSNMIFWFYNIQLERVGCESQQTAVTFNVPKLDLGPDIIWCDYENPTSINAPNHFDSYLWNTGDTTSSIEINWQTPSTNFVLEVNYENCQLTDTIRFSNNCSVSNREESLETQFKLYPNPNNGIFNLEITNPSQKNVTIRIFDLTGKEVFHADMYDNIRDIIPLNLENVERGVYFLNLSAENANFTEKIIIQ